MEESKIGKFLEDLNDTAFKSLEISQDRAVAERQLKKETARRIRALRQANRRTQDEVSEAINCQLMTYRGYENVRNNIPLVYLIRLADIYHVSLDYLAGRTDDMKGMYAADAEPAEADASLADRIAQLEKAMQELKGKA